MVLEGGLLEGHGKNKTASVESIDKQYTPMIHLRRHGDIGR